MVRNRRGRGLQGIVQVPNGGYLAKEEMKDLSMSGKMKEIKQMKGLGSLVKTTVLSKISDAPLRSEIEEINASKFVPDNNGKIVLPLSNERTMTLDM